MKELYQSYLLNGKLVKVIGKTKDGYIVKHENGDVISKVQDLELKNKSQAKVEAR